MDSQPRSHRPAATDYFNPAEQLALLNNIKAKVEKSANSTPQPRDPLKANQPSLANQGNTTDANRSVDYKAQELSLREKLEKAKADREARSKAEAALRAYSQPGHPQSTTTST